MRNDMFRRLPVEQATGQLYGGRHRLRVVYRTRDLIVLGLGVMIGAGIFKISGQQAAGSAGPAVIISFVVAGIVCLLAALSYAELSSIVPVAGSAYSFSYVAFGEIWAWVVGWALILELLLAASVLARAWSAYLTQTLVDFHVKIPSFLADIIGQQKGFDLFALLILLLVVGMLATGSRMGLRTLWYMVLAKLIVIALVIATGLKFFHPANLTSPFIPPAQSAAGTGNQTVLDAIWGALTGGDPKVFGIWGILAATPAIAFGYIGFDLIATASEETEDAPRKVPRGMISALLITIVLYIGIAIASLGMVSYKRLDPQNALLASEFGKVGADSMGKIIDVGVVLGLTTVILVLIISLTRVIFSMSRDGLLPRPIAGMSRFKVPSRATLVAGAAAILMSQTIDVLTLEQMVVIGTLFAFLFVAAAVLALRRDRPDLHRPFKVPAAPLTVLLTILATGWLMLNLQVKTWGYFTIWMAFGVVAYVAYGRRKSQLRDLLKQAANGPRPMASVALSAPPPGTMPPGTMVQGTMPRSALPPGVAPLGPPHGAPPGPPPARQSTGAYSSGAYSRDPYSFNPPPQQPQDPYQQPRQQQPPQQPQPQPQPPQPQETGQFPAGRYSTGPTGRFPSGQYQRDPNSPYDPNGPYGDNDPYADPYGNRYDDDWPDQPNSGGRHRR
ncbi:amino acid permease [Actinomadura barringtoniae]|uniref:Amino acid permease n=2 Tax=Actinomadura barringtoniae TaxID=1427535 RepID=A0A939P6J2_9ACTN|nr:amino acid permease [Actinomadura barringtoniae]